jgi:hypothetical protein
VAEHRDAATTIALLPYLHIVHNPAICQGTCLVVSVMEFTQSTIAFCKDSTNTCFNACKGTTSDRTARISSVRFDNAKTLPKYFEVRQLSVSIYTSLFVLHNVVFSFYMEVKGCNIAQLHFTAPSASIFITSGTVDLLTVRLQHAVHTAGRWEASRDGVALFSILVICTLLTAQKERQMS